MEKVELVLFITISIIYSCNCLDNGLALTPPMGWMHWQRFRCTIDCVKFPNECISENLFKRTADLMVSEGYAAAGYEYVIIDDCWLEHERDENGRLVADRTRFPNGIKALSDYIHNKGLKFGLYEDYGTKTCEGYPGIIGHMEIDAQTFADWEVDYVKLDGCNADVNEMDKGYPEFGRLLNKTGRPMVYSCSWPFYEETNGKIPNYELLKEHCNLWRNWGDIQDSWSSLTSITRYFAINQYRIQPHAGPGHWNDPDMLLLGNTGLSFDQSKVQMTIWAILAAPLLMSTDLATVKPEIKAILQNKEVIAVNQDPLGIQGKRLSLSIFTLIELSFFGRSLTMVNFIFCAVVLAAIVGNVKCLDNGLALTPPMGFMNWQRFRCITDCENYPNECISENLFKRTADLMVSQGYAAAGYEYVIIDDCWMEKERDENQKLVPDRKRFPNGLKALADYIHGKGLKFGLYEDYGTHTCAGYPGVINHMELDANTFAGWDVDYVKLDGCYADIDDMDIGYPEFGRLLNQTGRPMVYSCSWPVYQEVNGKMPNYEALKEHCNLWRNWGDIDDSWDSVTSITNYFAENQDRIQPHAGPGHWNDPDMLVLGNFGLSYDQSKAQMAVWAILAAPLLMSTDLATVRPGIKEILQNRDIIAVNQDRLGIQGRRISNENSIEVWARPITPVKNGNYSYAVAFVSHRTDGAPYAVSKELSKIGLNNKNGYLVEDLFDPNFQSRIVKSDELFSSRINPTGVQFYKFTAQ